MRFLALGMLMIVAAISVAWGQSNFHTANNERAPAMTSDVDVERLTAEELRAKPVYHGGSEKIATVSDVTGTPGQMRQAILYIGGVLGVGGKEVALPLNKLSVATDGRLVLTMTQDELKLLPRYR